MCEHQINTITEYVSNTQSPRIKITPYTYSKIVPVFARFHILVVFYWLNQLIAIVLQLEGSINSRQFKDLQFW